MLGYIHSLQSLGAVDGPGLRFVVFMQGCPLRCMYCHNPDTWEVPYAAVPSGSRDSSCTAEFDGNRDSSCTAEPSGSRDSSCTAEPSGNRDSSCDAVPPGSRDSSCMVMTVDELVRKILRYKPYFNGGGGVTVSGGEPLLQAEFVTVLFTKLHEHGIHTCLDTSGNFPNKTNCCTTQASDSSNNHCTTQATNAPYYSVPTTDETLDSLLSVTDLCICDIKFTTEEYYRRYTGGSLLKVLDFLRLLKKHSVPVWIRHVVVPGFTDTPEEINTIRRLAEGILGPLKNCSHETDADNEDVKVIQGNSCFEKLELLPFHKLCLPKYEKLGIPFRCADISECTKDKIKELCAICKI